jgi:hypothetical protein
MGMDAVEIVMAVEEQFGISIPDHEAEKISTPRMLINLVLEKVKTNGKDVCRTQRAFYVLRRFLMQSAGVPREQITLAKNLRHFIQPQDEAKFWADLQQHLDAKIWPRLELSQSAFIFISSAFLVSVTFGLVLVNTFAIAGLVFLGIVTTAMLLTFGRDLVKPWRNRIPWRIKTIRDLACTVAGSINEGEWNRTEITHIIKRIICDTLGLKESVYHQDADFVRDLGVS